MQATTTCRQLTKLLAAKEIFSQIPEGRDGGVPRYRLYVNVPVHCLVRKNIACRLNPTSAQKTIDILICRDVQPILAVSSEAEHLERLFSGYLNCLPHYLIKSDALTEEQLSALADSIAARLCEDCRAPQETGCCLYADAAETAVRQLQDAEIDAQASQFGFGALLHRKHLIFADGSIPLYGKTCGLFLRCDPGASYTLMCSRDSRSQLRNALHWEDTEQPDSGLDRRLNRIRQGLPSEPGHNHRAVAFLQQLLDTPLEEFFRDHPQESSKVTSLLNHAQLLSLNAPVTAFGDKEYIATFGDAISTVWNLREYTAVNDCRNTEAYGLCEELLWNLSEVLLASARKQPAPMQGKRRQSLHNRLAQAESSQEKYPVLSEPIAHYIYAGAFLSGSEFPLFLYQHGLYQYLYFYSDPNCSFRQALQLLHSLCRSDEESDLMDYSTMIFDLLVDTVSSAVI